MGVGGAAAGKAEAPPQKNVTNIAALRSEDKGVV